jgi:transglutaminase-like putative cysteine protease
MKTCLLSPLGQGRIDQTGSLALIVVSVAVGLSSAISKVHADQPVVGLNAAQEAVDLWWTFEIGGRRVGYLHETTSSAAGAMIKTSTEVEISIGRLGSKVEMKMKVASEEAGDGGLQAVHSETTSSTQATTMEAVVSDGKVRICSRSGGKRYERTLSYRGRLLGPDAVRRLAARAWETPGAAIEYQTFVAELEDVRKITRKVAGIEEIDVPSGRFRTVKATEQIEGYPSRRTIWLDREGRLVRHQEAGPFGLTEIVRSDRSSALTAAGNVELPSDLFKRALVRSNVRLPSPRTARRLVLRLTQKDPQAGWPAFDGPTQSVVARAGNSLMLETRQAQPQSAVAVSTHAAGPMREYLDPNPLIQSDDPEVRRICRDVVGDHQKDVLRSARQLEAWVHQNMTFDPGMVVVPASEVVRKRRGTCMAYSVLLATLARAAGIPSRVAMRYVYLAGVWGGHAWVEALMADQWVPLDAALPGPGPCDAARICCLTTSLAKGLGAEVGPLTQLFGNLDVAIVEYQAGSVRTEVPQNAKPHVVNGDVYRNRWVSITFRKPPRFKFVKLDAIYPDRSVLRAEGPANERVELKQLEIGIAPDAQAAALARLRTLVPKGRQAEVALRGRTAVAVYDHSKAACAVIDQGDLWVLLVESNDPGELLREVAAGLSLAEAEPAAPRSLP